MRRDFWGLLVSEVARGLKVPTGWSEGKDWALATRLGGRSFCSGLKEALGCKEKGRNRKGFGCGSIWSTLPRGRGWLP